MAMYGATSRAKRAALLKHVSVYLIRISGYHATSRAKRAALLKQEISKA